MDTTWGLYTGDRSLFVLPSAAASTATTKPSISCVPNLVFVYPFLQAGAKRRSVS